MFNLLIKLPPNPAILPRNALDTFGHLSNHLPQLKPLKPTARNSASTILPPSKFPTTSPVLLLSQL